MSKNTNLACCNVIYKIIIFGKSRRQNNTNSLTFNARNNYDGGFSRNST